MKTSLFLFVLLSVNFYGTQCQPKLVKDFITGSQDSDPRSLTEFNGMLYFTNYDRSDGQYFDYELWRTNGLPGGTQKVKDIYPGIRGSLPDNLMVFNNHLFFTADDGIYGNELWMSDGTSGGTVLLKDIFPGNESSYPGYLTPAGNQFFFQAFGANGLELWKSNGTAAGTVKVTDIQPACSNKSPEFTYANGLLFFRSATEYEGDELWRSDGTAAGTMMVKDIYPGPKYSNCYPTWMVSFNNKVYFVADDGSKGLEIWMSDGTEAGTVILKDIAYSIESSNPTYLTVVGNSLYFSAYEYYGHGYEVWKTDGTLAGTVMVKDIAPGSADSYPADFATVNGELYFTANDGVHGPELWKSDGTVKGTRMVEHIVPGFNGPFDYNVASLNDIFFFAAYEYQSSHNLGNDELWMSDGTPSGTRRVADILPGNMSSFPLDITKAGNKIFFSANDGNHGRELWVFEPLMDKVTGFTLVNAVSDNDITGLQDDAVINLAALPTNKLNVRVDVSTPNIRSVVFELNGVPFRTESVAPFALAGDNPPGNYYPWTPAPGHYELCAIPYSGTNGKGNMGIPTCIHFTVVNVSYGITHFTLVNAETNEDIMNFFAKADENHEPEDDALTFDLTGQQFPDRLNIRANTYPPIVGKVVFVFNGTDEYIHQELAAPYAMFGDANGNYKAWQDAVPAYLRFMGGSCDNGIRYCGADVYRNANDATPQFSTFFYFRLKYDDIRVDALTLVNAENNKDIQPLLDGAVIDLSTMPTDKFNIRGNTFPETVGSVDFSFYRTPPGQGPATLNWENVTPYTLFGDNNGNYYGQTITPGHYVLRAVPYNRSQNGSPYSNNSYLRGVCGIPLEISFDVVASGSNKTSAVASISDVEHVSGVQVFPNPSTGVFTVSFNVSETADVKIEMFDLFGKSVFSENLLSIYGKYQRQLDLREFSEGVYFLKTTKNNTVTIKKIIIAGKR